MEVKFFGHNCFMLKGSQVNVLTDPWFTKKGAFFGSWFQWPINHHLLNTLKKDLINGNKVILYISHEHQDHFDIETLKKICSLIDICIIPKYPNNFLKSSLEKVGFNVKELEDLERYKLSDSDYIEIMIVDTGVNQDSMAIIGINDEIFINQNDCKVFDRLNYLEGKNIKYYSVQFSGANWHPVCYDMNDDKKKKISKRKVLSKLINIKNSIELLKPKNYFPSAGPAIFPFLNFDFSTGSDNIFIHQPDLVNYLKNTDTEVVCLRPGDVFEEHKNFIPIPPPKIDELEKIKNETSCEFEKLDNKKINLSLLIEQLKLRLEKIAHLKFDKCPSLIFEWDDEGILIQLNTNNIQHFTKYNFDYPREFMRIRASKSYFNLMADSRYRWQDIYLTLRAKVKREPDIFNIFLNIFIHSDVNNILEGFENTLNITNEKIVIYNSHNNKNYKINRFCPHNGADLKNAKIDKDGNLICPRHGWSFNLKDSGKCKSADVSINALEIQKK